MIPSEKVVRPAAALAASVALIAALIVFTSQMVALPEDNGWRLSFQLAGYGSLLALTVVAASVTGNQLGLRWRGSAKLGRVLLVFAVLAVAIRFVFKQPPAIWAEKSAIDWMSIGEAYLVGRLLVPVFEEALFRGLFWSALAGSSDAGRWLPGKATLITAIVFGALHWPCVYGLPSDGAWPIVLSASAGGILFGILRQRTGSIHAAIAIHIIGNTIGF
jgi:membrane protease YdiL (CAAX protease family)